MRVFIRFIVLLGIFQSLSIQPAHGQDLDKFIEALDTSDIYELKDLAIQNATVFKRTGNKYYQFNEKLALSHLAKKKGNYTIGIRHLIWILEHSEGQNIKQIAIVRFHLASTLSALKAYKASLNYILPVINNPPEDIDKGLKHYSTSLVASNYFQLSEYDKALNYYSKAYRNLAQSDLLLRSSMLNNIGLCFLRKGQFIKANYEFKKGVDVIFSLDKQDPEVQFMVQLIRGNIGTTLHELNQFSEAERYLLEEYNFYHQNTDYFELAEGPFSELLVLYQKLNENTKAENLIKTVDPILSKLKSLSQKGTREPLLLKNIYNYYLNTENTSKVLMYSKDLIKQQTDYQKKIEKQSFELNEILYQNQLNFLTTEVKTQAYKAEVAEKQKRRTLWISLGISVFITALLILLLFYMKQRKNTAEKDMIIYEQKAQIETNKNLLLKNELLIQKENINSLSENLNLKKETEKAFLSKINEIKRNKNKDPEQAILELQLSVNSLLGVDKRLKSAKITDDSVNELFKSRLKKKHPTLTKSDLELCVLFKMKLSAKDIGAIRNMSPGTIRVYKSKIKDKIGMNQSTSLGQYLNSIS